MCFYILKINSLADYWSLPKAPSLEPAMALETRGCILLWGVAKKVNRLFKEKAK